MRGLSGRHSGPCESPGAILLTDRTARRPGARRRRSSGEPAAILGYTLVVTWDSERFASRYDRFVRPFERRVAAPVRRRLVSPLRGDVLDLGAGTGANFPFFPPTVGRVVALEPDAAMLRRAAAKRASCPVPLEIVRAQGERLPFPDSSFDAAVATLVLCTVRDLPAALAEVRRVLRPGGSLVLFEHVAARNAPGRWLQHAVQPLWGPRAAGCQLTRDTPAAVRAAGFTFERIERGWLWPYLLPSSPAVIGVACAPA